MRFNSKDLTEMAAVVRCDALRAVRAANSGHVGIVLGASDIITCVFANFFRPGRDRFVLSAGHGSAMLYATLKLAGYKLPPLESFRKMGGLPGHPEYGIDGVDATTGPLGQGVANAVGLALAEKIKGSNGRVYCLCSDGDLMEGVAQEAISFAGHYKLDNLVLLWDSNKITIDGAAQINFLWPEYMVSASKWKELCAVWLDPHEGIHKLCRALEDAKKYTRPVFIPCRTRIGEYSSLAGTPRAHGYALSRDEMDALIEKFESARGRNLWARVAGDKPCVIAPDVYSAIPNIPTPASPDKISTRELSGLYLDAMLRAGVPLVGGSADLGGSTNAMVQESRPISPYDFSGDYERARESNIDDEQLADPDAATRFNGNYINYGIREHAMGAIMNGLAVGGLRPYGSTFLVFSDYMRPAMRIAALSGLPVIYILTHDSIAVGEDGPTHQPIEQLPSLRLIPNMNVFRPCNMAEVAYAYRTAIRDTTRPTSIILSRQKINQIPTPVGTDMSRGAYIIRPARARNIKVTLLATGSEVPLAVAVAEKLGPNVQVASVPCVSAFRHASEHYKSQILRGTVVAIEAAAAAPWFEFADAVVGIDRFGLSGDGDAVYSALGFNVDAIVREIARMSKK